VSNVTSPNFLQASFSPETENMYCPISPTGRAGACKEDKDYQDEATIREAYQSVKDALHQKEAQLVALADVVGAETNLVKKSVVVTGIALLATFTFACCCWLIINVTLAVGLAKADWHYVTIGLTLLAINGTMAAAGLNVAQDGYKRISFRPALNALQGMAGLDDSREQRESS